MIKKKVKFKPALFRRYNLQRLSPPPTGTKQRVNHHIKFSLQTMFKSFPQVDKAIFLEDDLVLAKDFIR